MRRWIPALLLLTGCSVPEPRPLDPIRTETEFRARRLDDPDFSAWLEARGGRPGTPWTLDTLTLAAIYFHPDLDVARARLLGARADETVAGEIPNPVVGADLEKVLNGTPAGVSPWVYGLNLQMPLDFLWKRGWRIDEARAHVQGARLELAETGWQVRHRVRAALLEDVLVRREIDLRRREAALRVEGSAAAALLLKSGEASRLEADRARAEEAAAGILLEETAGRAASARAALAAAVGVPLSAIRDAEVGWSTIETPPDVPDGLQEAGLLNRLDVRRGLSDYAAAEAALGLELSKRYPDVALGPGYLFDQGDRKFTIGLSVTLPIFNQNGGAIEAAEARRQEAAARFLVIQARAIGDFEETSARYAAARAQLARLRDLAETLERRLAGVRRSVELGESDRLTLLGVRAERAVVESARLDAVRRAQEALGALEDAVQRPIDATLPAFQFPDLSRRPSSAEKEQR